MVYYFVNYKFCYKNIYLGVFDYYDELRLVLYILYNYKIYGIFSI